MKKVVYHGIRDIRVEDKPGRGEVKIKIKYCGICGSVGLMLLLGLKAIGVKISI